MIGKDRKKITLGVIGEGEWYAVDAIFEQYQSKTGLLNQAGTAPTIFITSTSFYDKFGRPLFIKNDHIDGSSIDSSDYEWVSYNFVGWEMVRSREHKAKLNNVAKQLFTTKRNTYDHAGRIINHYITVNNLTETNVSYKQYTELDQLKTKRLGTGPNAQFIDYKYNIRGWLTDINDIATCNTDLFRMKLNYNTPNTNAPINSVAMYNGNISSIEWRMGASCTVGTLRNKCIYGFSYDGLNRLTDARYAEINGAGTYQFFNRYRETLSYNDD